jgi:cytochrome c-type biogenesis protein CcmH
VKRLMLALAFALWPLIAAAAIGPGEVLSDPALEARARALGKELRCPVCQNQSLDDSDSDIARDLRRIVRERILAGDTDAEVKSFLVARYGDFVLLEPPMKPTTWALWFGPGAVVLIGGFAVWRVVRRNRERLSNSERDEPERP